MSETQLRNEYLVQRGFLYAKALEGVRKGLDRTREVLLWRGFLVMQIGNKLFLSVGSPREDLMMLRHFNMNIRVLPGRHPFPGHRPTAALSDQDISFSKDILAEIEPTEDEELLYRLFVTSPVTMGMCGPEEFSGWTRRDWGTFKRLRFGRKVPVEVLDPGVALIVKILPLLGLDTVLSCEGHSPGEIKGWRSRYSFDEQFRNAEKHNDTVPTVSLMSEYHREWARQVLPLFLAEDDPFIKQWTFETHFGNLGYNWRMAPAGSIYNLETKYEALKQIQRLARRILDSHWDTRGHYDPENSLARRIRDYKMRLMSPRDLEDPDLGHKIAPHCR